MTRGCYDAARVAARLAEVWDRPDLGASGAAWLDLAPVEPEIDRPAPVAVAQAVDRLRRRVLALEGVRVPVFLRPRSAAPPAPRARTRRRLPVGVLAASRGMAMR